MKPLLTIGMATLEDFHGTYFSLQSARLATRAHADVISFVIVDVSSGTSQHTKMLESLCANSGTKLVRAPGLGTSTARNAVIDNASGEFTLVMDCHVILPQSAWDALLPELRLMSHGKSSFDDMIGEDGKCHHLMQGPMMMDNLEIVATHFRDSWEAEMWGQWATAWVCKCGGTLLTPTARDGKFQTLDLTTGQERQVCGLCGASWKGEAEFNDACELWTQPKKPADYVIDIPGQGLGLFLTRTESWLRFPDEANGFGGEEMCVHELYRQRGRRAVCIPWLFWLHRFGRPDGIPYHPGLWDKVRNYALWFKRLGRNPDPIVQHFVKTNRISVESWDALWADPVSHTFDPSGGTGEACLPCGGAKPVDATTDLLFEAVSNRERDLNRHMALIRALANECEYVTEITNREDSTVAIADSECKHIASYQLEMTGNTLGAYEAAAKVGKTVKKARLNSAQIGQIDPTDMLFIDSIHTFTNLKFELYQYGAKARKFIVMHDTDVFGRRGEDGKPLGLLHAIADFMFDHPEWAISVHTKEQYGLTVITTDPNFMDESQSPCLPDRGYGPGTFLKQSLASIGIVPEPGCDCLERAAHMNAIGHASCAIHRNRFVAALKSNASRWGWTSLVSAAAKALATGLAFKLNPLDPIGSLFDAAVESAAREASESGLSGPIWPKSS